MNREEAINAAKEALSNSVSGASDIEIEDVKQLPRSENWAIGTKYRDNEVSCKQTLIVIDVNEKDCAVYELPVLMTKKTAKN